MIRINPVHTKKLDSVPLERILEIKKSLKSLAVRINPVNENNHIKWELCGGLAVYLTFELYPDTTKMFINPLYDGQGIVRDHNAFHLMMHESQLSKLEGRLADNKNPDLKYVLVSRGSDFHMPGTGSKIDRYVNLSAKEALKPEEPIKSRAQNLRFVRVDEKGKLIPHQHLLDYFDVYPYRYENLEGQVVTPWFEGRFSIQTKGRIFSPSEAKLVSWDKKVLHLPAYYNKTEEYFLDETSICLASLPWVRLVKENRDKQDDVDRYDLLLINSYQKAKQV